MDKWRGDSSFGEGFPSAIDEEGRIDIPELDPGFDKDLSEIGKYHGQVKEVLDLVEGLHDNNVLDPCLNAAFWTFGKITPRYECPGKEITLERRFPTEIDFDQVRVLFPTTSGRQEVQITSIDGPSDVDPEGWGTYEIVVNVPSDATRGCVFLYDRQAEREYLDCLSGKEKDVTEFDASLESAVEGYISEDESNGWKSPLQTLLQSGFIYEFFGLITLTELPESCKEGSFFEGSYVSIEDLAVDGEPALEYVMGAGWHLNTIKVRSGLESTITFRVYAADVFSIQIYSEDGERVETRMTTADGDEVECMHGIPTSVRSISFNPPPSTEYKELRVTISTSNVCSPVEQSSTTGGFDDWFDRDFDLPQPVSVPMPTIAEARLLVLPQPTLSIKGVEVTQCIQEMGSVYAAADANNSVELIKGRTTVVRVYVDSGLDNSESPWLNNVPIDGTLEVEGAYMLYGPFEAVNENVVAANLESRGTDFIRARPSYSLIFQIPGDAMSGYDPSTNTFGDFKCHITAWVKEHEDLWRDSFSFSLPLEDQDGPGTIMVVAYNDDINDLEVSGSEGYLETFVEEALLRYLPIPDDGLDVRFHSWRVLKPKTLWFDPDLTEDGGWRHVLDRLESLRGESGDDYTWIAIVPDAPSGVYAVLGMARGDERVAAAQQDDQETLAHEYVHTLKIWHTDCKETGGEDPCASGHGCGEWLKERLPSGRTQNPGIDVYDPSSGIKPSGVGDLMSYCDIGSQWTSTVLWERVRQKM
jgi:hypothetical protein